MKTDSCRQCVRRRIRCDATVPTCSKCKKKGITCSGIGKVYRFVDGIKTKYDPASTNAEYIAGEAPSSSQPAYEVVLKTPNSEPPLSDHAEIAQPNHGYMYSLESYPAGMRMLFHHFSTQIAPVMVVIDECPGNGYRDIILPLATSDLLVRQAASVTAALHIGPAQPHLFQAAEKGRLAIIQRLGKDASSGDLHRVFNISTWAALVLLLVAENVTGGKDFVRLFNMLEIFLLNSAEMMCANPVVVRFLTLQSQMFKFFTPPSLGPEHGILVLEGQLDNHMNWLPEYDDHVEHNVTSHVLKQAFRLAGHLYVMQVRNYGSTTDKENAVSTMIQMLANVDEDRPGMHAFVWSYFIAGAATSNRAHQEFFRNRLRHIYSKIKMRNILSTIEILERSIWSTPQEKNWTRLPDVFQKTLIM